MTDDDLKKIQKLVKDEIRPVKEVTEIIQSKMSGFDLYQRSTSINVRNLKDQLSVVNEKLDGMKGNLDDVKTSLEESIDQRVSTSESKIMQIIEEKLDERITTSEERIIKEAGNFIDNRLLPQLDDKAEKHITDRLDKS